MRYIITFEYYDSNKSYSAFLSEIEKTPGWANVGKYAYILDTQETSAQLRDRLKQHLYTGDKLFVCLLQRDAAWTGMSEKVTSWIKEYL